MIASTARIFENVVLGTDVTIEDYCIVGAPVLGDHDPPKTHIGDGSVLRSFTVIYAGTRVGKGLQTGNKANIREHCLVGDHVSIGSLAVVEHHVQIGNGVRVHSQAFIPEYSHLEDECWIGPNAVLTNARFPRSPGVKESLQGPTVRRGAMVGANATILPGVELGAGCLIGAGSVVTRNIPSRMIATGNPARVRREIHY